MSGYWKLLIDCILIQIFLELISVCFNKLFASFLNIAFGILWYLRAILGMVVVLLDESWVAGKFSDFSTEVKPVY